MIAGIVCNKSLLNCLPRIGQQSGNGEEQNLNFIFPLHRQYIVVLVCLCYKARNGSSWEPGIVLQRTQSLSSKAAVQYRSCITFTSCKAKVQSFIGQSSPPNSEEKNLSPVSSKNYSNCQQNKPVSFSALLQFPNEVTDSSAGATLFFKALKKY